MDRHQTAARLTPREREIAGLIGKGLTNKQIGRELSISERTVGAHVQNMLNKLNAANRAEIAVRSALATAAVEPRIPAAGPRAPALPRLRAALTAALLAVLTLVVTATDGGQAVAVSIVAARAPTQEPVIPGNLIFQAGLAGDGAGFGDRYVIGDPNASAIRFPPGAVEYVVLQPGGNTGNGVAMTPVKRYYVDVTLTVAPGSDIAFWLGLDAPSHKRPGQHIVAVDTWTGEMVLSYFVASHDPVPLSETVRVDRLERGRTFNLAALVDPPNYVVFVDGVRVIQVRHEPGAPLQSPAFSVFGEDTGAVRLTSVRVYAPD